MIAEFGFDHGFEVYQTATGDTRAGSFQQTVPMALTWIATQADAPWFAFVHGYDAHSPYVQPGPYGHLFGRSGETPQIEQIVADPRAVEQLRGRTWYFERTAADFTHASGQRLLGLDVYTAPAEPRPGERFATLTDAEIAHLRDHYDTGVAYGDAWLGLLLADIDLDHTVVIVLSDHGEDLLDHGFVNHRAGLWDSTTHVPLVAAGPGFNGLGPQSGTVDVRSVLPTLLQAAGALVPAGVSAPPLQSLPDAPFVFAEGVMDQVSVRGPTLRLTATGVGLPTGTMTLEAPATHALYAEPAPEDVAAGLPGDVTTLQDALRAWRAGLHPAQTPGAAVDPALRDALRKRGYWTPGEPTQPAPDASAQ